MKSLLKALCVVMLAVVLFAAVSPVAAADDGAPGKPPSWFRKIWLAWKRFAPKADFGNLDCDWEDISEGSPAFKAIVKWFWNLGK